MNSSLFVSSLYEKRDKNIHKKDQQESIKKLRYKI